ncbi:hypothetical protein [Saccharothrix variisporea]|uniref:Uncharacterized protein n=1 Tax=Saccharothrix variisporea TaxID=543527 RepID=A0A495XE35_9PSEU|nr:hypothetical protein [Saccharothrix variisporea]RKT72520.1 hypothetical protein DFJ66_5834 [Saccharothrix variisporea]
MTAPVVGLTFGLAGWLAAGLVDWAETPVTDDRPRDPVLTFRRDLRLVLLKAVVGGVALGIAFGVPDALTGGADPVAAVAVGVLVAVAIALGVGLHQASGRYLVAVAVLSVRRRVPVRLLGFLDDAHRLGVLRRSGAVYQFRHAALQDHLARTRPDRSRKDH